MRKVDLTVEVDCTSIMESFISVEVDDDFDVTDENSLFDLAQEYIDEVYSNLDFSRCDVDIEDVRNVIFEDEYPFDESEEED